MQQELQDNLLKLGELDTSLEDVNGYLQQVEDELSELDNVHGDPKYLETHIKKLKVCSPMYYRHEKITPYILSIITHMYFYMYCFIDDTR